MNKLVTCNSCSYQGDIFTFLPTASVYSDIRCPKCGSTSNSHNEEYQKKLFENMNKMKGEL